MDASCIYEDERLLIVNKPAGILVHRSEATSRREPALLQILRDRTGFHLFPVHRLDRPTSGVLVFAKDSETASRLGQQGAKQDWGKTYLAVLRGWAPEAMLIDRALRRIDQPEALEQHACTQLSRLATIEWDVAIDPYPKARYSLCQLQPKTGRRHQLRRHCKTIGHPIAGDTVYGQGAHNRFFREQLGIRRLLLHHATFEFDHPWTGEKLVLAADLDQEWRTLLEKFGWHSVARASAQTSVS